MSISSTFLGVSEVSARLNISPQYIRKLIRNHKIKAQRVGKQWIVSYQSLEDYMVSNKVIHEPKDHSRTTTNIPDIVALSFFSGAMGLDLGMEQGGISALLACECNKFCRMTIEQNRPDMALIGDINNYTSEQILEMANIPKGHKVDVIFGGPPCQAFSTAGKRQGLDDERGNVFLRYVQIINEIKPTYVVIENVRGLLSASYSYKGVENLKGGALAIILDRLNQAGYDVSFNLYNTANFGVPQIRERVVILGKLRNKQGTASGENKLPYLTPTHDQFGDFGLAHWRTLQDALDSIDDSLDQHYIEFPENRLRFYRLLKEGQYWKNLPVNLQQEAMGNKLKLGGGKTGFFRRLSRSKPSPTLVTNPTMPATDLCHPTEDRPLSVEEYAAIQEFPSSWKLCGSILEQYRQLGNAVPIGLGKAIAQTIVADMSGCSLPKFRGFTFSRYKNTDDVSWRKSLEENLEDSLMAQKSGQAFLF